MNPLIKLAQLAKQYKAQASQFSLIELLQRKGDITDGEALDAVNKIIEDSKAQQKGAIV